MNRSLISILLLLAVGAALFLLDPANKTFYCDDEWLYIGTASEMFDRGEAWITYWLGEPSYYKAPLAYWLMMPFFPLGADRILQGRLAIGATSVLTILATYGIGRRLYGDRAGLLAGLTAATSLGFLTYGRVGMLDMPLTLFLTLAAGCLALAVQEKSRFWPVAFWLCAGLSVLIKGPVSAVILLALALACALVAGAWRKLFFSPPAWIGMLIAAVLSASWPLALYLKGQGELWFRFFVLGENLGKFSDPSGYPALPFLAYGLQWLLPWTLVFLAACFRLPFRFSGSAFPVLFPLAWGGIIALVYLLPAVRLPWYLLPVVPPASLLVGVLLADRKALWSVKIPLRLTTLLLLLPLAVLLCLLWTAPFTAGQLICFGLAAAALAACIGAAWRSNYVWMFALFAIFIVTLSQGVSSLTGDRLPDRVARELRQSNVPVAAARISTGRLSQQLWFFSYHLQRKVEETRTAPAIDRFLTEQRGLAFITQTDLDALKKDLPGRAPTLQILYSWNYWKENIAEGDIRAALLEGKLDRLQEPVHVIGLR